MSQPPKIEPVPITPELQRNYERFVQVGKKAKTHQERVRLMGELIDQIKAEKAKRISNN